MTTQVPATLFALIHGTALSTSMSHRRSSVRIFFIAISSSLDRLYFVWSAMMTRTPRHPFLGCSTSSTPHPRHPRLVYTSFGMPSTPHRHP
ncbi:hypothetical protein C8R42DRAFT_680473 [Lentinula raphanica]|nr:hypothetical protein C8R42DRAFT_680473 [Lentinula raphanica]